MNTKNMNGVQIKFNLDTRVLKIDFQVAGYFCFANLIKNWANIRMLIEMIKYE